jgi:serine O-acetyltransferase
MSTNPTSLRDLVQIWREDLEAHRGDLSSPGFHAIALHRFGNYRMNLKRPWRAPLTLTYNTLFTLVRNVYGVEVPYSAKIGRRVVLEHAQCGIVVHGSTEIGDDCYLRQGCTLGNRHLDRPDEAPKIGAGVNIGAGAKILGNVRIGDGARIGVNAVVIHDVPAGRTAVAPEARLLDVRPVVVADDASKEKSDANCLHDKSVSGSIPHIHPTRGERVAPSGPSDPHLQRTPA